LNVSGPAVGTQPLGHRDQLPSSLGDAVVEQWCYFLDSFPLDPSVLPEECIYG
jgi:hypothetical protein